MADARADAPVTHDRVASDPFCPHPSRVAKWIAALKKWELDLEEEELQHAAGLLSHAKDVTPSFM